MKKCSLCNENKARGELCDRCWELKTRIEANPELALKIEPLAALRASHAELIEALETSLARATKTEYNAAKAVLARAKELAQK